MKKFKEFTLNSGIKILLGRDAQSNDELMEKFKLKENFVIHTVKPGSGFCVVCEDFKNVKKQDLKEAAIICAAKSQDWRDNKNSVKLHLFKAKDAYKNKSMKKGTWSIKNKPKVLKVKKKNIKKWQQNNFN